MAACRGAPTPSKLSLIHILFPSVNLIASSTRRDDLLHDKTTLDRMWILRKYIADMNPLEAMNAIHDRMEKTRDNSEFLLSMNG